MFSQEINNIKYFTDDFASSKPQLARIKIVSNYGSDNVVGAVARALLFNRLPEGESFETYCVDAESPVGILLRSKPVKNAFAIMKCNETDGYSIDGYTEQPKYADYLKSWMTAKILTKDEDNSVFVFIKDIETRKVHFTMSLFPAYYQKLFKHENVSNLTELEKELCKSLIMRTPNRFTEIMDKMGEEYGFKAEYTTHLLRNFTKNNVKNLIDNAKRERDRAQRVLEDNLAEYRRLFQDMNEKTMRYELLCAKPVEEDTELADFFSHNKTLSLVDLHDSSLSFIIDTKLEWFDVDFYEHARDRGEIFNFDAYSGCTTEDKKLLMDAIFSNDPQFAIRMCAFYEIDMSTASVGVISGYDYGDARTKKYIPNPHLQRHACLGSYREPIRENLRRNNIIGAIQQCAASAGSVNLQETDMTFKPFMASVFKSNNKILVDNEGNEYTVKEAIQKLKETK